MSKNTIVYILAICLCISSVLQAEDLMSQYKQKVAGSTLQEQEPTSQKNAPIIKIAEDDILEDIQNIKKMKQDTFESTPDFLSRRSHKIQKLEEKVIFYRKRGDEKFSFGSVTMKSYDADTERMLLTVNWNKEVYALFPELKIVHTAYLDIPRDQARELFGEKKKHYFHTKFGYRGEQLVITSMLLYNKYRFYAKVKRKPVVRPVVVKKTYEPKYGNSARSCDYYYTNASSINVRARPTTRSSREQRLNINKKVCVTKKDDSWSYIQNKGWVLSRFLQKTKVKKRKKKMKSDRSVWHCTARSTRASGWVERVGKENAKRGALHQCTMRLQTSTPCRITNCYRR